MDKKFNIIFLTETHFTKGQVFNIPDYKSYHNPISEVNEGKPRWGVSCFISQDILQYVTDVDRSFDNHIVILLKGGHRIFGSYMPRLIRCTITMQYPVFFHQFITIACSLVAEI